MEICPERKGDEKDIEKAKAEPIVDEACWIYEQLRSVYSTVFELWINLFLDALPGTFCTH